MAAPYQCNTDDEHLDMEYVATLRNLKPYITCVMNKHYIELIRVWVEKLSDIRIQDDKVLRNTYLVELGKQIVSGVFAEPFIDPPDEGPLPPFKSHWIFTKDKLQNATINENTDAWTQSVSNNVNALMIDSTKCSSQTISDESAMISNSDTKSYLMEPSAKSSPQNQLRDVRGKLTLAHEMYRTQKTAKKKKNKTKKSLHVQPGDQNKIPEEHYCCPDESEKQFALPYKEVRVYSPLRKMKASERKFNETDDSSWFDLTDGSTNAAAAFCSGDCDRDAPPRMYVKDETSQMQELYENKIADLINMIKDLRQENINLSQHVEKYEKERNVKPDRSLHNLTNEVECLKSQLQDLTDIKVSLQNRHFAVSSEWQSTVSALHKKLALLQRKNNELKLENNDLTRKLEEQDSEKRKALTNQKKKLSDFHNKETDMLKQIHARAITDLETKYIQKMSEQDLDFHNRLDDIKDSYENRFNNLKDDYDSRLGVLKDDYESRISSFSMEYEKDLSSRDAEIDRLEIMLQEQCVRMQEEVHIIRSQIESNISSNNESNMEKITFLQKCILKMEKLYQKSEKENHKQMTKLKRELEFRDKSNQLALTTQRADLISHTANGKQTEIDIVVSQLEEYYKKKLIELQQRAFEEKRQDSKLIGDLKDQLTKLNNEY